MLPSSPVPWDSVCVCVYAGVSMSVCVWCVYSRRVGEGVKVILDQTILDSA